MNRIALTLLAFTLSALSFAQGERRRLPAIFIGGDDNQESVVARPGVHRVGTRASAALPCTGSPKIPIILVQFADRKFSVAETEELVNRKYDEYFNLKEGNASPSKGSVYQYFYQQSGGMFAPEFDIIGPVTLSQGYAYYGKNKSSNELDVNIAKFYSEACTQAVSVSGKQWSYFDNNADGKVDMAFFIYAGEGENGCDDPNTIWPKESVRSLTVDKVVFGAYGCTNELYNGVMDGIGTAVHELSHGLGLPDIYDTSGKWELAVGMDSWDVMDGGNYQIDSRCPICYNAYQLDFMGWRKLVTLETDKPYTLTIEPLETTGVGYKIVNPSNANEYFILENRQPLGYDECMGWPNLKYYNKYGQLHGLMITHIDYLASAWTGNSVNSDLNHQRMSLVPADGSMVAVVNEGYSAAWASSMLGDLYPGPGNVTEMSSYAVYSGTFNQTINNIREKDGVITVDINGGTVIPALKDSLVKVIELANSYSDKKMGADARKSLDEAVLSATGVAADQDSLENVISVVKGAMENADASVELYVAVSKLLNDTVKFGDTAEKVFAASGIKEAFEAGTITSIEEVSAVIENASEIQVVRDSLDADVISIQALSSSKMNADVATALAKAIEDANGVELTKEAIASAKAALDSVASDVRESIEVYSSIASYIEMASKLGEAGQASFMEAGIAEAYENGSLVTDTEAKGAYEAAVRIQELADGVADAGAESTAVVAIFGVDGSARQKLGTGVNIVKISDGTVKKIVR